MSILSAGLPNIEGKILTADSPSGNTQFLTDDYITNIEITGAFTLISGSRQSINNGERYNNIPIGMAFNASRCSPVYGNSQTVQPSALSLIAQFRY